MVNPQASVRFGETVTHETPFRSMLQSMSARGDSGSTRPSINGSTELGSTMAPFPRLLSPSTTQDVVLMPSPGPNEEDPSHAIVVVLLGTPPDTPALLARAGRERVAILLRLAVTYWPVFPLVGRLARLGWTRIGSPSIFGVSHRSAVC